MKGNIVLILLGISLTYGCDNSNSSDSENINLLVSVDSQVDKKFLEIFEELRVNDSLLFDAGFNHCDTHQVRTLICTDFEFYHDQAGITNSVDSFIQSISGLCNMNYRPTRELDNSSLEVYILKNDGEIYGAIQKGKHRFYGEEENRAKYLTSTVDFTHLWVIEDSIWRLKRVLSYNHEGTDTK